MSYVLGYIIVAVISIMIAAYAIYKKRNVYAIWTFVVFYLFSASITWFGEFTVLGLFNSYAYKTDMLHDTWAQNLMGHLFLNISMFPAAAIVMIAYGLGYGYYALNAVIFVLVEYIFVKLGLYEQHWWKYYMSAINVIAFLIIAKKWFAKMNRERTGLTRAITFFFAAFIFIHLPSPILLLLGKLNYQLPMLNNIVGNFYRSSIMIAFTSHIILTAMYVYFVCILKKRYWKIAPFIISPIVLSIYAKLNILVADDGWKLIYYILIEEVAIALFVLLEEYTWLPEKTSG